MNLIVPWPTFHFLLAQTFLDCLYCFIIDLCPVYLIRLKPWCRNSFKSKSSGNAWRNASKLIPHVIIWTEGMGRHGYLGTLTLNSWSAGLVKLHCTDQIHLRWKHSSQTWRQPSWPLARRSFEHFVDYIDNSTSPVFSWSLYLGEREW